MSLLYFNFIYMRVNYNLYFYNKYYYKLNFILKLKAIMKLINEIIKEYYYKNNIKKNNYSKSSYFDSD